LISSFTVPKNLLLNYLFRHGIINDDDGEDEIVEGGVFLDKIGPLFSICNLLKAKEEAIRVCYLYELEPVNLTNWFEAVPEFLIGWDAFEEFFNSFLSFIRAHDRLRLLIHMTSNLLHLNSALCRP